MVPVIAAKTHFMKLQSEPGAVKTLSSVCETAWFRNNQGSGVTGVTLFLLSVMPSELLSGFGNLQLISAGLESL